MAMPRCFGEDRSFEISQKNRRPSDVDGAVGNQLDCNSRAEKRVKFPLLPVALVSPDNPTHRRVQILALPALLGDILLDYFLFPQQLNDRCDIAR